MASILYGLIKLVIYWTTCVCNLKGSFALEFVSWGNPILELELNQFSFALEFDSWGNPNVVKNTVPMWFKSKWCSCRAPVESILRGLEWRIRTRSDSTRSPDQSLPTARSTSRQATDGPDGISCDCRVLSTGQYKPRLQPLLPHPRETNPTSRAISSSQRRISAFPSNDSPSSLISVSLALCLFLRWFSMLYSSPVPFSISWCCCYWCFCVHDNNYVHVPSVAICAKRGMLSYNRCHLVLG